MAFGNLVGVLQLFCPSPQGLQTRQCYKGKRSVQTGSVMRAGVYALLICASPCALAGRPFVTDDAALTTAHACQLETWVQHSDAATEWWALPACNPWGNFELTAGFVEVDAAADHRSWVLQGKTLFTAMDDDSVGIGFAAGVIRPEGGSGGSDYAYIPVSTMSQNGKLTFHANLGWLRDRSLKASRATWAAGAAAAWS
ncbi:MAG: hypothetical protein L0099_02240, partial [Acidobacteria bacterium]|nr:hypothetical protein [Acidobacteriota bacterium]